jgi:hypothetical protein
MIVVILEVMWGLPGDSPRRWFKINPFNHSGKRLIKIIGHSRFTVTNACPDVVHSAKGRGKPDPSWLAANLKTLNPSLVIVCGRVARDTFKRGMVSKDAKVLYLPHPAARTWSKQSIERARRRCIAVQEQEWGAL